MDGLLDLSDLHGRVCGVTLKTVLPNSHFHGAFTTAMRPEERGVTDRQLTPRMRTKPRNHACAS